jgi:DnaJ-class molecular chaperone|tara:strand:- start:5107 stop:5913 length:807 start_codon:yes stop_codon:yes gene_type:complete
MDYYETLGVNHTTTPDEIKKAYRKLASKHHPDKGGDTKKFQTIQKAYEVLSDPDKKHQYDNPDPFAQMGGNPFGQGNFQDIFSDIFGGRRQQRQPQRNPDGVFDMEITLQQAFTGVEQTLSTPEGSVNLKIPAGVRPGTKFRLAGKAGSRIPQLPPGDLIVRLHIQTLREWGREQDNLFIRAEVNAIEAMLGSSIRITHLDGKRYDVTIPAGTQPDANIRMGGLGMPNPQNGIAGDLIIIVVIHVPTINDVDDIELLNKIINKRKGYK